MNPVEAKTANCIKPVSSSFAFALANKEKKGIYFRNNRKFGYFDTQMVNK